MCCQVVDGGVAVKLLKTMLLCVVRLLMAVLLKHTDLGHVVLGLMEHSQGETPHKPTLPRSVLDICRAIHAAKKGLIKVGMPLQSTFVNDAAGMLVLVGVFFGVNG